MDDGTIIVDGFRIDAATVAYVIGQYSYGRRHCVSWRVATIMDLLRAGF